MMPPTVAARRIALNPGVTVRSAPGRTNREGEAMIDATHDPARTSWVDSANGHGDFPLQNLPFGVFSPQDGQPRGGVAIGDMIFDIGAALEAGLFTGAARDAAKPPPARH